VGDDAARRLIVVFRPVKRRKRDGRVVVTLPGPVAQLLGQVIAELGDVFTSPPAGEVTNRLFPRAYLDPTEEHAEQDFQSLVHDDLVRTRLDAVAAMVADLEAATPAGSDRVEIVLDDEAEHRWLTVLNDARLTLGTVLGVTEDEPLEFPDDDPRAAGADMYALLSALQGELVEVVLEQLPETGTDDPDPS
jgi:uncharacterized protein DUF2017